MKSRESGLFTVEFAMAGLAFFILLFGVIEAGRWLFVVNTLTEATRRGARYAAMCGNEANIKSMTLLNAAGTSLTSSPLLNGLTDANVAVDYWHLDTATSSNMVAASNRADVNADAVRVRIINYTITLLIPTFNINIPLPAFTTTVPIESKAGSFC